MTVLANDRLLEVEKLRKQFGGIVAVRDVDFEVRSGEIMGLIGPNGAGKTTLFKMITGFLRPTSGRVLFEGEPLAKVPPHQRARRGIVCTFQRTAIFSDVSVLEATRMGQYRVTNSIALGSNPRLLLLDEPAAGLNPSESEALVQILQGLKSQGMSIVLVEHDMSVVMSTCERIVVIASGAKIAEGGPEEIRSNEAVIEAYLGAHHASA